MVQYSLVFNAVTINSNDLSINQVLYSAAAATPTTAPAPFSGGDFCRALGGEFRDSDDLMDYGACDSFGDFWRAFGGELCRPPCCCLFGEFEFCHAFQSKLAFFAGQILLSKLHTLLPKDNSWAPHHLSAPPGPCLPSLAPPDLPARLAWRSEDAPLRGDRGDCRCGSECTESRSFESWLVAPWCVCE